MNSRCECVCAYLLNRLTTAKLKMFWKILNSTILGPAKELQFWICLTFAIKIKTIIIMAFKNVTMITDDTSNKRQLEWLWELWWREQLVLCRQDRSQQIRCRKRTVHRPVWASKTIHPDRFLRYCLPGLNKESESKSLGLGARAPLAPD